MKTNHQRVLPLFVVMLVLFVGKDAFAWFPAQWCVQTNGTSHNYTWNGSHIMARDECSMPNGTDYASGYNNAGWQWNQMVPGILDYNWSYTTGNNQCPGQIRQNGINQTARLSASQLDAGSNGVTTVWSDACLPWTTNPHYTEADVKIADWLWFNNPDPTAFDTTNDNVKRWGRPVTLHEFGHVMGLGHSDHMSIMFYRTPLPLVGGTAEHSEPFPDDMKGVYTLYSQSTFKTNLFASAFQENYGHDPTYIVNDPVPPNPPTQNICAGADFTITQTIANNGSTNVSGFAIRVFMNATPPWQGGYSGGITLAELTNYSLSSFTTLKQQLFLTVPIGTPFGLYWIFWMADRNHVVSEWNEDDNAVNSGMLLNVNCNRYPP